MSRPLAWTFADLELGARRAAEDAARREGVTLEEWLSEAIEERAVGAPPRYRGRDFETRRGRAFRRRRDEAYSLDLERGEPEPEPDWVAAIEGIERRIALGERRAQRAFESIALAFERTQKVGGEASPPSSAQPSDAAALAARDERIGRSNEASTAVAPVPPADLAPSSSAAASANPAPTGGLGTPGPATLGEVREPAPLPRDKRQRDLNAAVSEIALRRRQLDARSGAAAALAKADPPPLQGATGPEPHDDLRALILRIEELGRRESENWVSGAEIGAMRAEIAGMISEPWRSCAPQCGGGP